MSAVVPAKPGPKGPHKVTEEARRVIFENSSLKSAQVSRLLAEQTGVQLTPSRIWQLRREAARQQQELTLEPAAGLAVPVAGEAAGEDQAAAVSEPQPEASPELASAASEEPPVVVPERSRGRYLGAALYYPALQALGLLEATRECFRLPNSELCGRGL